MRRALILAVVLLVGVVTLASAQLERLNGRDVWSGNLLFTPDLTHTLGAASANRPLTVFAGTVSVATDLTITNTAGYTSTVRGSAASSPTSNMVRIYIREDNDGSGAGGADCELVARLQDGTEVLITRLVLNGGCP